MPLTVGTDSVFCLDFCKEKHGFTPYESTIPALVYRKCTNDRLAFVFGSENVALTFGGIKNEVENLKFHTLN
ncbi:hypothetical protein niasHT_024624 [Heterodera trifolii]|uniref:Uncharacterized protein n=1 Tax=Heterodera trifolii TaxID=157864 RepID=A0ABD2K7X4_9BILA